MDIRVYLFENNKLRRKPILEFLEKYNDNNTEGYNLKSMLWRDSGESAETDFSDSKVVLKRVDDILTEITSNNIKTLFFVDLALKDEEEELFGQEIYQCELSKEIVWKLSEENQAIIIESSVPIEVYEYLIAQWGLDKYAKIKYLPAWNFESIHEDKMIDKVSHFLNDFFAGGTTK